MATIWWQSTLQYTVPGVLGVAGVAIGQVLAARQERKRWTRDDQRSRTARLDELEQRRLEAQHGAVVAFLSQVEQTYMADVTLKPLIGRIQPDTLFDKMLNSFQEHASLSALLVAVQVHCSFDAAAKAKEIEEYLSRSFVDLVARDGTIDRPTIDRLASELVSLSTPKPVAEGQ